jgi:large subunit ribosomal protein L4
MCLSDKAKNSALYVVNNFDFSAPKTKLMAAFLKALPAKGHSFLVVTAGKNDAVLKQTKNLQKVETRRAEDVAVLDLVKKQSLVLTVDAVKKLETMYA